MIGDRHQQGDTYHALDSIANNGVIYPTTLLGYSVYGIEWQYLTYLQCLSIYVSKVGQAEPMPITKDYQDRVFNRKIQLGRYSRIVYDGEEGVCLCIKR